MKHVNFNGLSLSSMVGDRWSVVVAMMVVSLVAVVAMIAVAVVMVVSMNVCI